MVLFLFISPLLEILVLGQQQIPNRVNVTLKKMGGTREGFGGAKYL